MCHEEGGEHAAVLEDADLRGAVVTVDALHTSRKTADAILRTHGADYRFTVKGNAPETHQTMLETNRERDAQRRFTDRPEKPLHGRLDTRSIECIIPLEGLFTFPHAKQMFRITRERKHVKSGKVSICHAYGISSLCHERATPEHLLSPSRRHWTIENGNHRRRDTAFHEDACLARTGHGPANNVAFSNLALAIFLTRDFDCIPAATDHFQANRHDALKHILAKRPRLPYHAVKRSHSDTPRTTTARDITSHEKSATARQTNSTQRGSAQGPQHTKLCAHFRHSLEIPLPKTQAADGTTMRVACHFRRQPLRGLIGAISDTNNRSGPQCRQGIGGSCRRAPGGKSPRRQSATIRRIGHQRTGTGSAERSACSGVVVAHSAVTVTSKQPML